MGVRTVFIDPEGEYGVLTRKVGGVYVRFSLEGEVFLNPFDLEDEEDERGVRTVGLLDKIADLKGLLATMVEGAGARMTPEESAIVEDCLHEVYREIGITSDPESLYETYSGISGGAYSAGRRKKRMPTLSTFYECLSGRGSEADRLLVLLKQYLRGGSLGIFDGESSVDLKEQPIVAFDVSNLEEKFLRPLAMHVVLSECGRSS